MKEKETDESEYKCGCGCDLSSIKCKCTPIDCPHFYKRLNSMNTIHQWLEGKKKKIKDRWRAFGLQTDEGKLDLLADFKAALPSLLSAMEAEIRVKTGEPEDENKLLKRMKHFDERTIGMLIGENQELSRIHAIIHEIFNPQE